MKINKTRMTIGENAPNSYNLMGLTYGKILAIYHALGFTQRSRLQEEIYQQMAEFIHQIESERVERTK